MTKRMLKQLVRSSYAMDTLNGPRVKKIASYLSRRDLKEYIRALKLEEKKKTVVVEVPSLNGYNSIRKVFENLFKKKHIVVDTNPSLLLGLKIIDNDMVFESSLKQQFDEFAKDIDQSYE